MKYRRTFVAVNLPEKAKKTIIEATGEWRNWPVRWTFERDIHLTLEFLGDTAIDEIALIGQKISEVAARTEPFNLIFDRFVFGPKDFTEKENPRMIWLEGPENENLVQLQNNLTATLGTGGEKRRKYRPHITIGRIKPGTDFKIFPRSLDIKIVISFVVKSMEFMESELTQDGRKYTILLSAPFGI